MSCDDLISTTDLENAKLDAITLGEVATSREGAVSGGDSILTTTDRFGRVSNTVLGQIRQLGYIYTDPIPNWPASTLITEQTRVYRYPADTGDLYVAKAATPFATGATFNPANWQLVQGTPSSSSSAPLEYATVDDMKSGITVGGQLFFPVVGESAKTQGYYAAGDGGAGEYLISTPVAVDGFGDHTLNSGDIAILQDDATADNYGITTTGDQSARMQAALNTRNKFTMKQGTFTFDSEMTCPDDREIDLNGAVLVANHNDRLFRGTAATAGEEITNFRIYNGTLKSINGISGPYIATNEAFRAANSYVNNVRFETWGNDAWRAVGNCNCPYMEFDDIRDNPVVTSNDNNSFGRVIGGDCGGDGVLFKGSYNSIEYFKGGAVGYRADISDFTAGSLLVIGADFDDAKFCYAGHVECEVFGGLALGIAGSDNTVGTVKAERSGYSDLYPVSGTLSRKVETANLAGFSNTIDALVITDSVPRGIGVGSIVANNFTVKMLEINQITVELLINIDLHTNENIEISNIVCNTAPNKSLLRIVGDGFKSDSIVVKNGTGGGTYAASITGENFKIGRVYYNADPSSSSGIGFFIGAFGSIDHLQVVGFGGTSADVRFGAQIGRYYLENNPTAYDRILKVRSGSKYAITNSTFIDNNPGGGARSPLANDAGTTVIFSNNVSANMDTDGSATVTNVNNI